MTAFSIVMYVDSFVSMLIFEMCDALQPPIIHCYGAGLKWKVKAFLKRIMAAGAVLYLVSMMFMFFAG
ncbi:MAG: hypothetical protein IJH34_09645 [Romboutsia sp.]|nr:hypothetical protein [Romboutsia sp.]SFU85553.1 hypothetical protein SAMN04487886_12274 [Clostridium sp. DSM 8431]